MERPAFPEAFALMDEKLEAVLGVGKLKQTLEGFDALPSKS